MASTPVYTNPPPLLPSEIPTMALAEAEDAPSQFKPYPTGKPLSAEDEIKRAAGIPLEEQVIAP